MVRRLRLVAAVAIVGLMGSLLVAPLEAGAAPADYVVSLGSQKLFKLAAPAPALGTRFYAPSLRVHRGDTIKFRAQKTSPTPALTLTTNFGRPKKAPLATTRDPS